MFQVWFPTKKKCETCFICLNAFASLGLLRQLFPCAFDEVEDRTDSTGLSCRACEPGTFSVELHDDKGLTHVTLHESSCIFSFDIDE